MVLTDHRQGNHLHIRNYLVVILAHVNVKYSLRYWHQCTMSWLSYQQQTNISGTILPLYHGAAGSSTVYLPIRQIHTCYHATVHVQCSYIVTFIYQEWMIDWWISILYWMFMFSSPYTARQWQIYLVIEFLLAVTHVDLYYELTTSNRFSTTDWQSQPKH